MMTSNTFADVIGPLAEHFFGQPTKSTKTELRFGTHGSKRIDLKNGTWFDHEVKTGGGVLDLIKQEKGFTEDSECYEWMEREGYWSNTRANGLAPSGLGLFKVNSKEVAHHDYVDEGGNSLFQVVKLEPKDFRQRRRRVFRMGMVRQGRPTGAVSVARCARSSRERAHRVHC